MIKRPKQVERSQKSYLSNERYQDYAEQQFKTIYDYLDEQEEKTVYSTEEKEVGTWIDNRPLYQKTIVLENQTISGTEITILDITNYDIVLIKNFYINGDTSSSAGNRYKFLQNTNDSSSYCVIRGYQNDLLLQANNHKYINKAYITVQYTKK